ncbi:hypothetical protein BVRB_8g193680 [Beta vulgaris subsp. vulgaris]|nr:hypothetical protein BVRB_8g193680 [Beta vulgaris subsp. vulgaris]
MSWLSISLPNPFKSLQISEEQDDDEEEQPQNDVVFPAGGVKEDFSAIGETIGRQFRAFISPETSNSGESGSPSSRTFEGIRSDLEEIKGTFKSSLSLLSSNRAVSEISKLASNFLQFNDENDVDYVNSNNNRKKNDDEDEDEEEDDDDYDGVGINDEVIEFANQISNRPQLWSEFPLPLDHELDMSEAQYEHASIIEQLVPSLGDIRSSISSNKSEKQFWMIYFILLLPRLNEEDAELLSTPEIVDARETLLKMLQAKKSEENVMTSENPTSTKSNETNNTKKLLETEDGSSLISSNDPNQFDAKPENSNVDTSTGTSAAATTKEFKSEDDVSFSDLEDDNLLNRESSLGPSQLLRTSSPDGSNDWVQLNKNVESSGSRVRSQSSLRERDSEGEDSTGWLTVDDFDP